MQGTPLREGTTSSRRESLFVKGAPLRGRALSVHLLKERLPKAALWFEKGRGSGSAANLQEKVLIVKGTPP